jgi:hypothetical protein
LKNLQDFQARQSDLQTGAFEFVRLVHRE